MVIGAELRNLDETDKVLHRPLGRSGYMSSTSSGVRLPEPLSSSTQSLLQIGHRVTIELV